MKLGNLEIMGDLALAPMAGVTDLAFRTICAELGAAVTVTEMVSSRALIYQDKKSRSLLHKTPLGVCGAQIFGNDPSVMADGAALALEASGADFIDINMGCPAPKIAGLAAAGLAGCSSAGGSKEASGSDASGLPEKWDGEYDVIVCGGGGSGLTAAYSALENGVSGVRTAKAFANEELEKQKFDAANDMYRGAKKEYYKTMGAFMSGMEFTTGIMPVVVIAVGGVLIINGRFSYIDLITFTLYVSTFINPVRKLAQFAEIYMQGAAGFERFLEIMRTEPEIVDAPDAVDIGRIRGDIALNDVSFTYDSAEVLHHVSLRAEAGKTLALIGPSGGGKTTISQLIMRFYDVSDGSVTVDGTDVRGITQASLRRNIGIIQQDVYMFAGTVRENIRYGRPDATDEEIVEAARLAELHDEIMQMPDGYDSYIGERGVMLSGGQKQRISIARVFLKNPPVLILDEATSALDTVTERRIQASLDRLCVGRTSIVIAHRLSTIRNADSIAVIEHGRIAEQGNHEELLALGGTYFSLAN